MSQPHLTTRGSACPEYVDLLVADALDVLGVDERRTLMRHLARCPGCQAELEVIRVTCEALARAVPQVDPPPALRERVLAAAAAERPSLVRRLPRTVLGRRAGWPRLAPQWAAVAAAVVIATGSLAWVASLQAQVASLSAQAQRDQEKALRYDRVVQVLASPHLVTRAIEPARQDVQASGTIYLDPATSSGMVMVHHLPPLPEDRSWQLWFVRDGQRQSGGLLYVNQQGTGYSLISVPADLESFESIGITAEPKGGSPAPTTPRVVGARL